MDRNLKWYNMSKSEQISNIGSEVERALKFKSAKNDKLMLNFVNKAIEFIEIIQKDPKNIHNINEFSFCKEELIDYFIGENIYNTTPELLRKYYNAFL